MIAGGGGGNRQNWHRQLKSSQHKGKRILRAQRLLVWEGEIDHENWFRMC